MKKNKKVYVLVSLLLFTFSCEYKTLTSSLLESKKDNKLENISALEVNSPVNIDIKILNPDNKSKVEWYKKDDKTIVMKIGSQADITGTAVLKDNTKSSNVTWASSDNTVAIVNNGKVTANKIGTTTILAVSNIDSNYKGLLNIEVVNDANFSFVDNENINKVKSIDSYISTSLGNQNNLKMKKNTSVSALSVVTLNDGTKNSNIIWESSDENIATVDKDGKITTNKIGVTTIVSKYKLNPNFKSLITIEVLENIENNSLAENKNISILPYVQANPIIMSTSIPKPNEIVNPIVTTPLPIGVITTPVVIPTVITSEAPYVPANLVLDKITITENGIQGNGDGVPNKGEKVQLSISLKNIGGNSSNSVNLKASTTSSFATIDSYFNNANYSKIASNDIKIPNSGLIYLTLSSTTPPNTIIPLIFTINDEFGNKYTVNGSFTTQEINNNIVLDKITITENGIQGNGDGVPNKGEKVQLSISLKNIGGNSSNSVNLKASTTSSFATIDSYFNNANYSKIASNDIKIPNSGLIYLTLSSTTPPNTIIPLIFTINDEFGNKYTINASFTVK